MFTTEILEKINLVIPEQDRKVLLRNILNNKKLQELLNDKEVNKFLFEKNCSVEKFEPENLCQHFLDREILDLIKSQSKNPTSDTKRIIEKGIDAYQRLILQKSHEPTISDAYLISFLISHEYDQKTKEKSYLKLLDPEKNTGKIEQILDWVFACLVKNCKDPWTLFQQILYTYPVYTYIESQVKGLIFNLLTDEQIEDASLKILNNQKISLCNQYLEIIRRKGLNESSTKIAQSLLNSKTRYQYNIAAIQEVKKQLNWRNIGKAIELLKNFGLLNYYAGKLNESVDFFKQADELLNTQREMLKSLVDETDLNLTLSLRNENEAGFSSSESRLENTDEDNLEINHLPLIAYKKLNALIQQKEYEKAEDVIQVYLEEGNTDPNLITHSAMIDLELGGYLQALQKLEIVASLNPNNFQIRKTIAEVHFLLGNHKQAYDTFLTALPNEKEINDKDLALLCEYALRSEQPQKVLLNTNKWIDEKLVPQEFLLAAAEATLMLEDYEKAQKYLQQAIIEKKDQPRSWLLLFKLHKKNGQVNKPVEALLTGLKYCPRSQDIYLELVKIFHQFGNFTQGKKYIDDLIGLPLQSLQTGLDIAQFLVFCGEQESAQRFLTKAIQKWPKSQSLKLELSRILVKNKQYSNATELLEQASNDFPLNHDGLKLLLLSLFRCTEEKFPIHSILAQDDEDKIEKAISNLLSLSEEDAWGNLFRAVFLTLRADYSNAYEILSDFLARKDAASEEICWKYLIALGQVMMEIGKTETAISLFEEVIEKRPNQAEVYTYLAESYANLRLNEKALEVAWLAMQHCEEGGKHINWLCEFLFRMEKIESAVDQITQKEVQKTATPRELLLLGFLLRRREEGVRLKEIIHQLISAKMDQDETMQYLKLVISCRDYKMAEEILQKNPFMKEQNMRKINFIQSCLDYHQENYLKSKELLINNINQYKSSNMERILLLDTTTKMAGKDELKQFLNDKTASELASDYRKAVLEFEDFKEMIDVIPENWKNLFLRPEKFANLISKSYLKIDEPEKTKIFFDHILSFTKFNIAILEMAADFERNHLNFKGAYELIKSINKNNNVDDPQKPISLACLEIELLLHDGKELRAASLLNEVVEQNEDCPRLLAVQSRILLRQSNYESAFNHYEKAKKTLKEIESWILDAALEIGDHEGFIDYLQKMSEGKKITPFVIYRLLQEKAEILKLNYHLNELKSVNKENQRIEKVKELISELDDNLANYGQLYPEIAMWDSINQSLETNIENVIPLIPWDERTNHMMAFLYRIFKNGQELEKLLVAHPADPEINFQMALFFSGDNPIQSRQCFTNAIAGNPRNPLYYAGLSFFAMKDSNYQEALQFIEQALLIAPNETEWQKLAMIAAEHTTKWDKVIFFGEAALSSKPDDINSARKLLHAYIEKGDFRSSEKLINKFKFYEDQSCEVMIALGRAALMNANFHKAIEYAHQAQANNPASADPFILLSQASMQLGQFAKAFEYAQLAVELEPDQSKTQVIFSSAIRNIKGIDAAMDYLFSIINKGNHSPEIYVSIADLIKQKNGPLQALQFLNDRQAQPNDKIANLMAHLEHELNNDEQAADYAKLSLVQNPGQPDLMQMLGEIAEREGNLDQAIKYFYDAISLDSAEPSIYIAISKIFIQRREYLKALEILENGVHQTVTNWQLYQQIGKIYWDGKNFQKAEEYLLLAHQLNPSDEQLKRQLDALTTMNIIISRQEARVP